MENDLKGNENWFELTGGSSYRRGFELPGLYGLPKKGRREQRKKSAPLFFPSSRSRLPL